MNTTKQLFWQKHLNTWPASGQSQVAYCKIHKLKIATFTYWRGKQKTPASKLIPVITRSLGQVSLSLPGGVQLHLPTAQLNACTCVDPARLRLDASWFRLASMWELSK